MSKKIPRLWAWVQLWAGLIGLNFSVSPAMGAVADSFVMAGKYRGEVRSGARLFPHIAYAKPPLGHLRWKRAVLEEQPRQRTAAVACAQNQGDGLPGDLPPPEEDCLYLNVWAPLSGTNHPVVFFIHGGALLAGAGLKDFYDGSVFARRDIVFVSFNYRLAELGYGPKLESEPGSLGLLDQALALKWVSKNIAKFGGDPKRVFLMGHSKGAEAVGALLETGLADGMARGGFAFSAPRHFDEGCNRFLPETQRQFLPEQKNKSWRDLLTEKGVRLYVPEVPRIRGAQEDGPKFRLFVSSLYDERFAGFPSEMYCTQVDFMKQHFPYIESFFYVLHPGAYDHGAEVVSLFRQDFFGQKLMDLIVHFTAKEEPPKVLKYFQPATFSSGKKIVHLFPHFSFMRKFQPQGFGPAPCQGKENPGSQVSWWLRVLDNLSFILGPRSVDPPW